MKHYLPINRNHMLRGAYIIAFQHRHSAIEEAHVLLALLDKPDEILKQLFNYMALDVSGLKQQIISTIKGIRKVPFWKGKNYKFFTTPTVKKSLEGAVYIAKELGEEKASSTHIFWGIIDSSLKEDENGLAEILRQNNITAKQVFDALKKINGDSQKHETKKEK